MRNRALFCYAQTLMEIARQRQTAGKFAEDLTRFSMLLRQDPSLKQRLEDPLNDLDEKKELLENLIREASFDPIIGNFLQVMMDQHHEKDYDAAIEVFLELADAEQGILRGEINTAHWMPAEQINRLEAAFSNRLGQTVVLSQRLDPGLIGGLRVELAGKIYDGTLQSRLSDFFQQVSGDRAKTVSFKKDMASIYKAEREIRPRTGKAGSDRLNAEVCSAVALTELQQKSLVEALSKKFGKEIRLTLWLKPELLGGITVRVGDIVYDGSLSRRLDGLKKAMLQ